MLQVTFKGKTTQVKGPLPKVGSKAPDFVLVGQDLNEMDLRSFGDKKKLLNVFISLDTGVCAQSVHTFYEKAHAIPNLTVLNISMDLPFAAGRFCKDKKLENVITLSAFRSTFAKDYGVEIVDGPLRGLLARAVFVISEKNTILYSELVSEITHEPNYRKAALAIPK